MDKQHILEAIRRTAAANGGVALGRQRFLADTGIKETDWRGKHWARWADALAEAGLSPNKLNTRLEESAVLQHLANLTRRHGRFPTQAELRLERRANASFPSDGAIGRLGGKTALIERLREFCVAGAANDDVLPLLTAPVAPSQKTDRRFVAQPEDGYVYLIQSGRFFKVGRTNALGRREREIALQLPDKAGTVHCIRTDDPVGIEAYWHRRFEEHRRNGEWFELTREDVHAFKRRKFM